MSARVLSGAVFIGEQTPLPAGVSIESDAFVKGWRIVRNLDTSGLARKIEEAKWNLFYLAGEMRAIAIGREGTGTLLRAVKGALAKLQGQKFNCFAITRIVSKRFLGIPFTSIATQSRHIQRGSGLVPAKNFVLEVPASPFVSLDQKRPYPDSSTSSAPK